MTESIKLDNLNISVKNKLLKNIFEYFTEKGYRFAIGQTVEPISGFEIEGKPFKPTPTALILEVYEKPSSDYTDVKYYDSLEEIIATGVSFRNELIIFAMDRLTEEK